MPLDGSHDIAALTSPVYPDGLWWAWSATCLTALWTCPRKFGWVLVEGRQPANRAMEFGQAAHEGWAVLDVAKLAGIEREGALETALLKAYQLADGWVCPPDDRRNRDMLGRLLTAYADEHWGGAVQPEARAGGGATEITWALPGGTYPDGRPWVLCGHMDSRCTFAGLPYVRERKTTAVSLYQYWRSYVPWVQLALYDLAEAELVGPAAGVILEVASLQTNKADGAYVEFDRKPFLFTPQLRAEFKQQVSNKVEQYFHQHVDRALEANQTACGAYGGCAFRGACSIHAGPSRDYLLDKAAPRGVVWSPLSDR